MNIRIQRSPEGADSAGATVLEAPETAAPQAESPETQVAEAPKEPAEKPKYSDWDRYKKLQEKAKDPNAKYTKADQALAKKYEGKDESVIDGYKKPEQPQDEDDSPAPEPKVKKPEVKESPLHKMVGAKSDEELAPKVQGLIDQVKKFTGERGEVGRVLEAMGAKSLTEAKDYVKNAKALDQLVKDLRADKPEAWAFIGKPKTHAAPQKFDGEIPGEILDEGLYKHLSPQLKAANERAERLERELQALKGEWAPIRETHARSAANSERVAQVNAVVTEVASLVESAPDLWDSKKHGSLSKALGEYYESDGAYNPGLKSIVEILELAKQHDIRSFEIAHSYWERKNGGSLLAKAREDARQPFIGKKPSVGLSDQQGNHNGQFKTFTETHVKEMVQGKLPIPREWRDASGTLIPDKIPAHLRGLIFPEE